MDIRLKIIFSVLMINAFVLGFINIYFPLENFSFERLHIFLFNLCTGGTVILYHTRGKVSAPVIFFFTGSVIYAFSAFFRIYFLTVLVSPFLLFLVEKIRIEKFSLIPVSFFRRKVPVSEKFHHASLLCLSTGILIACLVILNNEYFNFLYMEKLKLNIFFLGFSFPISLISLSVVFSMLSNIERPLPRIFMEICFWVITLGVIVFFIFILFERFIPQIFVTSALFVTVVMIFYLYREFADRTQQKAFLSSGIGFLIVTAITGIIYIFLQMSEGYEPLKTKWLLNVHVFASLYGWNFCGLAVICRFDDFPIRMHSQTVIFIHWLTVILLAPLGVLNGWFAIFAVTGYSFIILILFFSTDHGRIRG